MLYFIRPLINKLKETGAELYNEFESLKRETESLNIFVRYSKRFSLTAKGDINTYQLFSGLDRGLIQADGRAGFIVPTGIATDKTNAEFFADLVVNKSILSLFDFENREGLFEGVHRSYKFCLLTLGGEAFRKVEDLETEFAFFLTHPNQLDDELRRFHLTPADFIRINPNTKTTPIFRTKPDAELTRKIHKKHPVLIRESDKENKGINSWDINTKSTLHMSSNADAFYSYEALTEKGAEMIGNKFKLDKTIYYPVYESKMIHQYDFRFAEYDTEGDNVSKVKIDKKADPDKLNLSRYWISEEKVNAKFKEDKNNTFLFGFRKITRATDSRTVIASIFPFTGLGDSINSLANIKNEDSLLLLSNLNSIVLDYFAKNALSGINLSFWILKQLPIIKPEQFDNEDKKFIKSRALELTFTSNELRPYAKSLGYYGEPFEWDEERRAILKAELDAYYAKLYGLTEEELRYILDPEEVYGEDFPGETFRVLKNKEIKKHGEYRTKRLVLDAWERLQDGRPMMSEEEKSVQKVFVDSKQKDGDMKEFGLHQGIYSINDAADITQLSYGKVRRWFQELMNAQYEGLSGAEKEDLNELRISFHGLIELVVIGTLRDNGFSLQSVLQAREELGNITDKKYPFATNNVRDDLEVSGNDIVFKLTQEDIVMLDGTGQYNLEIIKQFFRDIEFNTEGVATRILPSEGSKFVVIDPKEGGGRPVIKGKGVWVESIVKAYSGPDSVGVLADQYDLKENEIQAALDYAKSNKN